MREIALVDQPDADLDPAAAAGDVLALLAQPLVTQERSLVERELETDRVDRHDGGKQRGVAAGAAGDEIAFGNAPVADPPGHRRLQLGELDIELGLAYRRLLGGDGSLRNALRLRALLEGLFGDGAVAHELRGAGKIAFGERQIGTRLRKRRARLRQRGLERTPV